MAGRCGHRYQRSLAHDRPAFRPSRWQDSGAHFVKHDWRWLTPEAALGEMYTHLQWCQKEGLLDTAFLQILYDLSNRMPERADYPALQAIAQRWSVL